MQKYRTNINIFDHLVNLQTSEGDTQHATFQDCSILKRSLIWIQRSNFLLNMELVPKLSRSLQSMTAEKQTKMDIVLTNIVVSVPPRHRTLFRVREFRIPFGSHVLIHGPSGIGKTTLLHLIAGLFLPDEGDVSIGEFKLRHLTEYQRGKLRRDHIGIIFQRLNLIDHLNVQENVSLSLAHNSESLRLARIALDKVNVGTLHSERVGNLSQGEQQRVAIARVLAPSPSLILADEPTSNLDDKNTTEVVSALFHASEHRTLVVVSHDNRIPSSFDTVLSFQQLTSE